MKKILFIVIVALFSTNCVISQTQNVFSKSYDYVNDFEKILTQSQISELNTTLKSFEKKSLYKIIIVSTSSINPYTDFPDYSLRLDHYLINDLKLDPTILIVVSKELRQIQVQSIDLIRYKLSDDDTKNIIANFAVPEFRKGDYYKGLEASVAQIINKLNTI
ncbi:TPM domain-containing protein [Flavobacterium aquidurense]|uniref:TPM domain-containing protein n=1 Tax=Flavobacterium aquidurense TaxID=362413 RepID=UPI002861CC52|nr:TPM domain-containing protein [Flavobacterium aquidurense]MDR7372152.1 uncharacterized protein [Flavobacterium aquidurense]